MDDYKNPKLGKTYISPSLQAFGDKTQRVRIVSKMLNARESYAFGTIRDEVVLRHEAGAQRYIKAKFIEDGRSIFLLSIQGYTAATDKPHNASFSFVGQEIHTLLEFVTNCRSVVFRGSGGISVSDEELRRIALSKRQAESLVEDNEALFAKVVASAVTEQDVIAVAYRKKQLEMFDRLLTDVDYFDHEKEQKHCGDEALWQGFFEKNPWIFGYGLSYIYLNGLDDKKLEQVVQGHRVGSFGKRADALMKSASFVSSLCFVEIKTHRTALVGTNSYRAGCWPPSVELAGAVSQVQGTVASAMETLRGKIIIEDDQGFPTDEVMFNYAPRSYLVVGNLESFVGDHGVNEQQFRSFELFRRNILAPEILTFDELYERARFIVHQHEH